MAGAGAAGGAAAAAAGEAAAAAAAAAPPPAAELFRGLGDFRSLARQRALELLGQRLRAGSLAAEELEPWARGALHSEAWEAREGALRAAAEALRAWDRPAFRRELLAEVPRLLFDGECRVRQAVAPVLRECCRRDGLAVYDELSELVLGDIRGKFSRPAPEAPPEAPPGAPPGVPPGAPEAPPSFLPDTEGWRSLETSMGALEAMMQGCGTAFTPRISDEMLGLLHECSRHTNRFVREYAYFALRNVFDVCTPPAFLDSVAPQTVRVVAAGIRDNWSQVRYAASVAVRAFMDKAAEERERFYPELLGPMCLNRHYVAEGVRLFSQETWRQMCGPLGGARLLVAHLDNVIDAYAEAAAAPNHAVREAACHCMSELAARVAGSPGKPGDHREHFTGARVQRLLQTLLAAFQDESWPVRDVASTALGHLARAFPDESAAHRAKMLDLWFEQMADSIPSLRRNGASALTMAVEVWWEELWEDVLARLQRTLPEVMMQPENSEIFSDYTPSGPFSVPRPRPMALGDRPEPAVTDQTMYSCGSVAPKTFRRRRADAGGCGSCDPGRPTQLWEASEGMAHLLAELAALAAAGPRAEALDALAEQLPALARAFGYSRYRHHHLLKQRVCERLPALSASLGRVRLLPHLPELLRTAAECAAQDAHPALREAARAALACWRGLLTPEDAEAACAAARADARLLLEA